MQHENDVPLYIIPPKTEYTVTKSRISFKISNSNCLELKFPTRDKVKEFLTLYNEQHENLYEPYQENIPESFLDELTPYARELVEQSELTRIDCEEYPSIVLKAIRIVSKKRYFIVS